MTQRVLLIVSGGIAAYKSLELVRQLRRRSDRPVDPAAIADLLMSTAKSDDDASCLVATCS